MENVKKYSHIVGTQVALSSHSGILNMNRKLTSGFTIPLKSVTGTTTEMDTDEFQCGQSYTTGASNANLSDSPERVDTDSKDPLNLLEPNIHEVLAEIDIKFQERLRIATMKENLLFYEDKPENPGFLTFTCDLEANFAREDTKETFMAKFTDVKSDLKRTLYARLMALCKAELDQQMQSIIDKKEAALQALDIKNPASGPKRTELSKQFDSLRAKYSGERAKYAAKLRLKWNNRKSVPEKKKKNFKH